MILSRKKKPEISENGIIPERLPVHVAIIMDGNGRWARKRGLPRVAGHAAGVKTVDRVVEDAVQLGIKVLTLYTFSSENWSRPIFEINSLMDILQSNLLSKRQKLLKNGVRLRISGNLTQFPSKVITEIEASCAATADCKSLILNLALGYSGREEIVNACREISMKVMEQSLLPEQINDKLFASHLYTKDLPDPELIIRTSGECRLSNFLLWQSSYSELYFTKTLWPDFKTKDLIAALIDYQSRERRFGGVLRKDSPG
jgi:undecaprenyl diphosphate synthase